MSQKTTWLDECSEFIQDDHNHMMVVSGVPTQRGRCFVPVSNKKAFRNWEKFIARFSVSAMPDVDEIIYHDPYTTVKWKDGTKTVVSTIQENKEKGIKGDKFDKTLGFYAALAKKVFGKHNRYKKLIDNAIVIQPKYLEFARGKERKARKKSK